MFLTLEFNADKSSFHIVSIIAVDITLQIVLRIGYTLFKRTDFI